jgi:hypothetical protein
MIQSTCCTDRDFFSGLLDTTYATGLTLSTRFVLDSPVQGQQERAK